MKSERCVASRLRQLAKSSVSGVKPRSIHRLSSAARIIPMSTVHDESTKGAKTAIALMTINSPLPSLMTIIPAVLDASFDDADQVSRIDPRVIHQRWKRSSAGKGGHVIVRGALQASRLISRRPSGAC